MAQKITPYKIIKHAKELIDTGKESGEFPFMIFDIDAALERLDCYLSQLKENFSRYSIAYSYKSNNLAQWCQVVSERGFHAEVCSADEMRLAQIDGFKSIVFDGPLKLSSELIKAIEVGALVEIDNVDECKRLEEICQNKGLQCKIHIRLSHFYDDNLSRFGLSKDEVLDLLDKIVTKSNHLILSGFHLHVGSNLPTADKICNSIKQYEDILLEYMPVYGTLNLGSGIPADSFDTSNTTKTPEPECFFSVIRETVQQCFGDKYNNWNYMFEPGRHFVEDFGYFIGKVSNIKKRYGVNVAQSNIGINWIPSVRNWDHSFVSFIHKNRHDERKKEEYILAGFNCFECDCLFPSVFTPKNLIDSFFSIRGCGAYDMQTSNQWTRRLYPIYSIAGGVLDISRAHRQEHDFRRYDISNSIDEITITDNIVLSYPQLKHSDQLFKLIQDNKLYFSNSMEWPKHVNELSDSISFIEQSRLNNQNNTALVLLIIFESRVAGVISFNNIDCANHTAYMGYWLGKRFQGKGIITQSIKKLIHDYSSTGKINRFVIKCAVDNIKSNAVALRCGFTLEGVLRNAEVINGVAHDQNIYAKLAH